MKVVKCPACSGVVSTTAESCPHCGHPFKPQEKSTTSGVFWGLFLFFIALPIVVITCAIIFFGGIGAIGSFFLVSERASKEQQERAAFDAKVKQERERTAEEIKDLDAKAELQRQREQEREEFEKSPAGIAEREKLPAAQRESERTMAETRAAEEAKKKELRERPARERLAKVIAYQLTQASNGLPSFQLEIGKRYLRGDGVPMDAALARHWLQSAATNTEAEAIRLLGDLKP